MLRQDKELFCYFSGYSQLNVTLNKYTKNTENGIVTVECENESQHQLTPDEYIQLNGVLFQVTRCSNSSFSASTTIHLLANTSCLFNSYPIKKLSLGIMAEKDSHDSLWMLQPSACGTVTYKGHSVLVGHHYTLKLNFEAPTCLSNVIIEDQHIGLSGSSLTVKEVRSESNLIKFSIYCGKETREKTQFNEDLPPETQINITERAAVIKR